jgi:multisubunit Na+/H+ antiporter MnhE subunit
MFWDIIDKFIHADLRKLLIGVIFAVIALSVLPDKIREKAMTAIAVAIIILGIFVACAAGRDLVSRLA